jgi:DNA-binding protein Fis
MEEIEKRYINHLLEACGGNQTRATDLPSRGHVRYVAAPTIQPAE